MKIRTILALVAIMVSLNAMSQAFTLTGVVTDSITGDELGYATVAIKGTSLGTTTDEKGNFSITVPHYDCHLTVTYMGYKPIDCEITSATPRHLRLAMTPSEYTLKEVVIKKHHEKYSKKNNPAVELIKNMIAHRAMPATPRGSMSCPAVATAWARPPTWKPAQASRTSSSFCASTTCGASTTATMQAFRSVACA